MSSGRLKPGWTRVAFGDMATCVNDRIDNPADAGVERYVGLEHLDSDSLTIRRWGVPSDVSATKLRFQAGDIIFGRRRVYQRKLGVADFDGICSAHSLVLRANPEVVVPEFLPFFMQTDIFMDRAKSISVGSLSPTINWTTLAEQEFALSPLGEQSRIVDVLSAVTEASQMCTHLEHALIRLNSVQCSPGWTAPEHGRWSVSDLLREPPRNGISASPGLLEDAGPVEDRERLCRQDYERDEVRRDRRRHRAAIHRPTTFIKFRKRLGKSAAKLGWRTRPTMIWSTRICSSDFGLMPRILPAFAVARNLPGTSGTQCESQVHQRYLEGPWARRSRSPTRSANSFDQRRRCVSSLECGIDIVKSCYGG